ncbi:hypothetical protein OAO18_07545 [Francisellaceae bacterium]|nr:hypothetical protein [Francisellaceae bacterium]
MSKVVARDKLAQHYVNAKLGVAKTKTVDDFLEFHTDARVHKLLSELIEVKAKGFRGVVLTALTGLHLNESYEPLNNFYGCHPRSIFENGIWYALDENNIPCGKSDPLNVAKNTNQLNEDWADAKRPQSAAIAAVNFLRLVIEANKEKRARLIDYFFFRLWSFAQSISDYKLVKIEPSNHSNQIIGSQLVEFTLKYPESGNLPQYLVAQLLLGLFRTSNIEVIGGDESVFGTNTTSKKPADIWLELDGVIINLYEVTVKPVPLKRLDDSLDALYSTGHLNYPVTFICRMDLDVQNLNLEDGSFKYKGKRFDFIDYRCFCLPIFALLNNEECSTVLTNIADFVQDKNISMGVKTGWNEFFSS